jgi:hypothetical protein
MTSTFSLVSEANPSLFSVSLFLSLSLSSFPGLHVYHDFFLVFFLFRRQRRIRRRKKRMKKKKREKDNHQLFLIIKYIKFILSLSIYLFRSDNFTNSSLLIDRRRSLLLPITNRTTVSFFRSILLTRHTNLKI